MVHHPGPFVMGMSIFYRKPPEQGLLLGVAAWEWLLGPDCFPRCMSAYLTVSLTVATP